SVGSGERIVERLFVIPQVRKKRHRVRDDGGGGMRSAKGGRGRGRGERSGNGVVVSLDVNRILGGHGESRRRQIAPSSIDQPQPSPEIVNLAVFRGGVAAQNRADAMGNLIASEGAAVAASEEFRHGAGDRIRYC